MKRINWNFYPLKSGMVILAMACLFASSSVFADGDTRVTTKAEKDFAKSVYDVFAKALPSGPEGWERSEATEVKEVTSVYSNAGEPFLLEYMVAWQDSKRLQEAKMKENEELEKLAKGPVENLTDKNIQEISKKTAAHDATLKITLEANRFSVGLYDKAAPAASIAGGLVFKSESKFDGSWREGTTYIFLGKGWKLTASGGQYVETSAAKGAPSAAAQTIVVKIQADPERTKQVISKIDWEALKKLIKN